MLSKLFTWVVRNSHVRLAMCLANLVSYLLGRQVRFSFQNSLLQASQRGQLHFAGTAKRGLVFLTNGLSQRGKMLRSQYLLDFIGGPIKTVIDVGANSGDLILALPEETSEYIAFEPIHEEWRALEKNCGTRGFREPFCIAASNSDSDIEIYVSTQGGDSSVIQPANGFSEKRTVAASKLDSVLSSKKFHKEFTVVDLLKIEAEGFEPEVLEGSIQTLKICRWVVIDGGPERGLESRTTIEICANMLMDMSFELVALNIKSRPGVGIFKNAQL